MTGDLPADLAVAATRTASSSVPGSAVTPSRWKTDTSMECIRSDSRQITPFGLPVVPPVYMKSSSDPGRGRAGRGACAASNSPSSAASGTAASGTGTAPTLTSRRSDGSLAVTSVTFPASSPLNTMAAASASASSANSSSLVYR